MAQSSKYAKLDQDVLLEFIYHDQTVSTLANYQIEIDDNGSHVLALNTTTSTSDSRHLIHELGSNVVNFDVTSAGLFILIENFASRPLTLQNGKTYKFNLSALVDPTQFSITGGGASFLTGSVLTYTPTVNGIYEYSYTGLNSGKITVQNTANPLYATADEETGNDIKTGAGQIDRFHAVLVDDINGSKYALLDSTSNFIDNNPDWEGSTSSTIDQASAIDIPSNTVTYDTVRLHLKAGFSFAARGYQGFLFQIAVPRLSGVRSYFTSIVYLNSSSFSIQNPKPFIIGETMYSKFIEVKVPALVNMNPDFINWFFGTGSDSVDPTANYEITYKLIDTIEASTGFEFINTGEEVTLTVSREDEFFDIAAVIEDATDGDYFNLFGTKDGSIVGFDTYINNRIQTQGDDITVFHDISVYEQISTFFDKTYEMSIVQTENFDQPIPFRPIVENAANAAAYNIDYVLRIYNEKDNSQIVKRASFTSYEVGLYGKRLRRINLPSSNQVMKVYNTLPNVLQVREIAQNLNSLPQNEVRFVPTFIERMNIVTGSTNVTVSENEIVDASQITYFADGQSTLSLSPYDNFVKFKIAKRDGANLIAISLESVDKVLLNLGSNIVVENSVNYTDVDLSEGEIMFSISSQIAQQAKAVQQQAQANGTQATYTIAIQNGSTKTMVHHGTFNVIGNSPISSIASTPPPETRFTLWS